MKSNPNFPERVFVKLSGNPLPGMSDLECRNQNRATDFAEVGKEVNLGIYELKTIVVLKADPTMHEWIKESFVDEEDPK